MKPRLLQPLIHVLANAGEGFAQDDRFSPTAAHWAVHGAHAQSYHTFTPARGKDWTMAWESSNIRFTPTTGARGNYVDILTDKGPIGRSRRPKVWDVQLK